MAHRRLVLLGLVIILIKGIVGPNIREECSDLSTEITYRLHTVWSAGNECGTYVCKKLSLPNVRNEVFAVAMKIGCVRWHQNDIKQTHCINLEPGTGRNYTECCHTVVCVEGSQLIIYGTDMNGNPKYYAKKLRVGDVGEVSNLIIK